MGSLTSGPRPPAQQPVFVPQPAQNTPAPVAPSTPSDADTQATQQEADQEIRRQSLLGRERSRFGTIQTSFRGLLGLSDGGAEQRKTLLGQ